METKKDVKPPDETLEIIADNLDSRIKVARHHCGYFTGTENVSSCSGRFSASLKLSAAPVGSRHTLAAGLGKMFSSGELHMSPEAQEKIERKIGQPLTRSRLTKPGG